MNNQSVFNMVLVVEVGGALQGHGRQDRAAGPVLQVPPQNLQFTVHYTCHCLHKFFNTKSIVSSKIKR